MLVKQPSIKTMMAIVLGNAFEWYDFVIYSLMIIYMAPLFFPAVHPTSSLLAATATFGVAFCMRPIGALVLGFYADRVGRKPAMIFIMTLMAIATFLIATMPTYAQIGIAAPCLILLARLLQGFSAGAEFGPSTALLIELAPPGQRGYYGAWQMVGQNLSAFFGALSGMLLTFFLSPTQLASWGWRLPFIAGCLIAPLAIYLRHHLHEPPQGLCALPIKKNIVAHRKPMLLAAGLTVGGTVATYTKLYLPTYIVNQLHLPMRFSFLGLMLGGIALAVLMPIFGMLSDRVGRKPILLASIFMYLLLIYPLFYWLTHSPSLLTVVMVEVIFCIFLAGYFGVFAVVIATLFPKEIRSTSLAMSYNLTVMLFGGFAPFIVTYLINITGNKLAIAYYLVFAMIISLIAACCYREDKQLRVS